ncbi:MAG: HAD-IIB family hydrolase [Clostridiales bacterium]|nr:HAD-IIB family hydrolase [Clostridiales bacterium]
MGKKMFFMDLDGTVLRDDKSVPEENIAAIREALDAGHFAAIATGRSTVSAIPVARELGMLRKGCFLISYNGAKILGLDHMEMLRELFLPEEYAAYLFAEAERCRIHVQSYSGNEILARRESPELQFYVNQAKMPYRIISDLYEAGESSQSTRPATPKVLLASLKSKEILEKFRADHLEWERGRCVSVFSAPEYLEYCHICGTKADGISYFEKYLGIAHEDTVAMGDEENDLAMIRAAGVGAAMRNAADYIRNAADLVPVRDNNEGGVAEVIRMFLQE